ncbi:hypothetical protein B0H13DRAFT_1977275 [Mycena leptocephala]|nr:hypothetical protein B0H13DRAFT_1977275 [Mycena leptocephala]
MPTSESGLTTMRPPLAQKNHPELGSQTAEPRPASQLTVSQHFPTLQEQNIAISSLEKRHPTTSSSVKQETRAHRNRIAAQNSRDRRKAQFAYLQRRVSELEEENRQLRAGLLATPARQDLRKAEEQEYEQAKARENEELRERIKTLEKGWDAVMKALAAQVLSTNTAPPVPSPASEPPSTTTTEPPASQQPPHGASNL